MCEPPQSPPGDDNRTTARAPGTAPDAPGAPIRALPDFPPSPACGGPPAPPPAPAMMQGAPVRRSGRRQPALTPPRPPRTAASHRRIDGIAHHCIAPTDADRRRSTPTDADRSPGIAVVAPRTHPQDGARRPRTDGTPPSGWRGSVGPWASGTVLGVRAGGATTAMPGDRSASVGVDRRNAVMSNTVDAAAPARCAGGAVASRRVGGVLTGVPAPPAAASASARAAPRTRGTGGKSGRARIGAPGASGAVPGARAVVRLSSPGGDLGVSHTTTAPRCGAAKAKRLSSPGGDLGVSHTLVRNSKFRRQQRL